MGKDIMAYFDDYQKAKEEEFKKDKDSNIEYANKFVDKAKTIRFLPLKDGGFFRRTYSYRFPSIAKSIKSPLCFSKDNTCLIEMMLEKAEQEAKKNKDTKVLAKLNRNTSYYRFVEYWVNCIEVNFRTGQPIEGAVPKMLVCDSKCFDEIMKVLNSDEDGEYKLNCLKPKQDIGFKIKAENNANGKKGLLYTVIPTGPSDISEEYYESDNLPDVDATLAMFIKHPLYIENFMNHYLYNKTLDSALEKLKYKDYLLETGDIPDSQVYDEEDSSSPSNDELDAYLSASKRA